MTKVEYANYLNSEHWKRLRARKKRGKIIRCAICSSNVNIHTHHLFYRNIYDVEISDLRLLCERCHTITHDLLKSGELNKKYASHHAMFGATKEKVKKTLGLSGKNLFRENRA